MQTSKIILIVSLCTNLVIGGVLVAINASHSKTKLRLADSLHSLTNAQTALVAQQQSSEMLESRVARLTGVLTNSTAQLLAANARIEGYELAERERLIKQREPIVTASKVPPPQITVTRNGMGGETKTYFFSVIMDKEGNIIGRNAKFGKLYGRRLSFWPESGTIMVDVDQVHPEILRCLNIDAEAAKLAQIKSDASWKAKQQADYQAAIAFEKARAEQWEIDARRRIEEEKANAEIAKVRAQERAALESAQNDRMKAQAALRAADAAMIEATKNAPQIIIQNANQNAVFR